MLESRSLIWFPGVGVGREGGYGIYDMARLGIFYYALGRFQLVTVGFLRGLALWDRF